MSVDLKKAEIRDWADKIERALEKKGIVPASERQRDAKGYLARIKSKADKPDAEPKPETDIKRSSGGSGRDGSGIKMPRPKEGRG